jgi:nucleoside-diphosphate-sugar epimerase
MRDVLVLGGTQYFGMKLVQRLIENGDRVSIATRGNNLDPFGDQIERLVIDRMDKNSMINAFGNEKWDLIYDQSCLSAKEALDATKVLKGKVKRYIFTSTQAVYDYGTQHKEENFNPSNFTYEVKERQEYAGYEGYQEAKRASEAIIHTSDSFESVLVRVPIVISEDDYTNRLKFHVDKVVQNKPIGINNPNARYSFIIADEAADFLFQMGMNKFTGAINPGCDTDISLHELVGLIGEMTGNKPIITTELTKENASPFSLPGSWSINTEKAKQLGYHFTALEEALTKLINYYVE